MLAYIESRPRAVMWSKLYGSERIMISKQMIAKLYTSPRWVPRGGGKFSRNISGDVHNLPTTLTTNTSSRASFAEGRGAAAPKYGRYVKDKHKVRH